MVMRQAVSTRPTHVAIRHKSESKKKEEEENETNCCMVTQITWTKTKPMGAIRISSPTWT
jgi:hypothetical protein